MAKKRTDLQAEVMTNLLAEPAEALDDNEAQALSLEEQGQIPPAPEEPVVAEAKPAEVVAEPKPEEPAQPVAEASSETPIEEKPLSPAQARIRELVAERNEYAERTRKLEEQFIRLEERRKYINEQAEAQRQEQEAYQRNQARLAARPDPLIDPMGAKLFDLEEEQKALKDRNDNLQKLIDERSAQMQVQNEVSRFQTTLQQDIASAPNRFPQYEQAARYAAEKRFAFWKQLGHSDEVAQTRVNQETLGVAKEAFDNGRSPTEIFYNLAQEWGWKPNGNGKPAPAASATTVSPQEKLQQIAEGQKTVGFGTASNAIESDDFDVASMTAADIARMSDDQFEQLANHPDKRIRTAFHKRVQQIELGA